MSESAEDKVELAPERDPIAQFEAWFAEAKAKEPKDPDAAALATVDANGMPNARMVLLKGVDGRGFVFYTNRESAKGEELTANPRAALCFHWKSLGRQVRVRGGVVLVGDQEADGYFTTRPKEAQIGAWASRQSRELEGRFALEKEVARFAAKYALKKIPRPPFWVGYRLQPLEIEFWRVRRFRLHDRLRFVRETLDGRWRTARLFP